MKGLALSTPNKRWGGNYNSSMTLCIMIDFLCERRVVTGSQRRSLHRARVIRNRVVHDLDMSELADLKQLTQKAKLELVA